MERESRLLVINNEKGEETGFVLSVNGWCLCPDNFVAFCSTTIYGCIGLYRSFLLILL